MQENTKEQNSKTKRKFFGYCSLVYEDNIVLRSMQETIRILDTKAREEEHDKEKLGHECNFADHEARNMLVAKDLTLSIIKYARECDYHSLRDALINNNVVEERCPKCNNVETWDHKVRCLYAIEIRKNFIALLLEKLLKKKPENVDINLIMAHCEDFCTT